MAWSATLGEGAAQNELLSAGTSIRVGLARPHAAGGDDALASTSTGPTAVFRQRVTSQSPKIEITTGKAMSGRILCTPLATVAVCIVINREAQKT